MKRRFKANDIGLDRRVSENYDSSDLVVADKENGPGLEVKIHGRGCEECEASEVYHYQLQVLQDNVRMKVERWIECRCGEVSMLQ
jgi:DNA-directed RNA polymerase subunit M/transcription elongation factor TFIIS